MSILLVRARKRFAMRCGIHLHRHTGSAVKGLLIEMSTEGMRISNLGQAEFAAGEAVSLELDGGTRLSGRIRWSHDGLAGVKLDGPLLQSQLAEIVQEVRGADPVECDQSPEMPLRRFGT